MNGFGPRQRAVQPTHNPEPRPKTRRLTLRNLLAVCSCNSMFSFALSSDAAPLPDEPVAGPAATGAGREAPPAPPFPLETLCRPLLVVFDQRGWVLTTYHELAKRNGQRRGQSTARCRRAAC